MEEIASDFDYITYEEFTNYKEAKDIKLEYSNGYIYLMTPTHPSHNRVQNRLLMKLSKALNDCNKCEVFTSDIAVRFEENNIKHQFEPDLMVTCDDTFDKSIYVGVPTLIIEVLSRATKERDLGIKLEVYEKFGVKEYWIVDLNNLSITSYTDNRNGRYCSKKVYSIDETISWNNYDISLAEIFKNI